MKRKMKDNFMMGRVVYMSKEAWGVIEEDGEAAIERDGENWIVTTINQEFPIVSRPRRLRKRIFESKPDKTKHVAKNPE